MKVKGYRTYMAIAGIIITAVLSVIHIEGVSILTPEVTAAVEALLGALAIYFRSKATGDAA